MPLAQSLALALSQLMGLPSTRGQAVVAVGVTIILLLYFASTFASSRRCENSSPGLLGLSTPWTDADRELAHSTGTHGDLAHNYGLSAQQCNVLFPELYVDIVESSTARKRNPISLQELDDIACDQKHTRAMVFDGELFIIDDCDKVPDERTTALLSSLHRALVADPDRSTIPNIEFVMSRDDFCDPQVPLWCMTRYKPPVTNFIIPDFGFWSWPISSVGSYTSVQRRILEIESSYAKFEDKIPRLIWRGSLDVDRETRTQLIDASPGQSWSDVEPIEWLTDGHPQDPPNLIPIEDHCRYQFIAHSEGNTFSGRQKYIQNCNSVVFAHYLTWAQPFHRAMIADGPEQNYVQVNKDYSDLAEKMDFYLKHPEEAARIAANSVKMFRNRYLTPATEPCYWRRLIREYAAVSFRPQFYAQSMDGAGKVARGTPYENYLVRGTLDYRPTRHWAA